MNDRTDQLIELIRSGEHQAVELKQSLAQRRQGLMALCGMLNTDAGSGTVIFGISPDYRVIGVAGDLDAAQRSLSQHIENSFDPKVLPNVEAVEIDGKYVIAVGGQRPRGTPYHEYQGRAFLRIGSETKVLTVADKQTLSRRRSRETHNGPWRCDRCGAMAGQISGISVTAEGVKRIFSHGCGGEWWPA